MGPLKAGYETLSDAKWNEKLAAILLIIGIITIGLAPFWLNNLVSPASEAIMQKIALSK